MAVTHMHAVVDVFDDEGDMRQVDEIAWRKLKEARLKDGFADGKYLGEESTLQNGFDHGYFESFELNFPFSIVQGLLAAIELQIKPSESVLWKRSREIKVMMDQFKDNLTKFKLKCLLGDITNNDDMSDCEDENSNKFISENSSKDPKTCYFSSLKDKEIFDKNGDDVKCILGEFLKLKETISIFVCDCKQPLILDQISPIFARWGVHYVTRFSPCETECACSAESSCTSSLPARS